MVLCVLLFTSSSLYFKNLDLLFKLVKLVRGDFGLGISAAGARRLCGCCGAVAVAERCEAFLPRLDVLGRRLRLAAIYNRGKRRLVAVIKLAKPLRAGRHVRGAVLQLIKRLDALPLERVQLARSPWKKKKKKMMMMMMMMM